MSCGLAGRIAMHMLDRSLAHGFIKPLDGERRNERSFQLLQCVSAAEKSGGERKITGGPEALLGRQDVGREREGRCCRREELNVAAEPPARPQFYRQRQMCQGTE